MRRACHLMDSVSGRASAIRNKVEQQSKIVHYANYGILCRHCCTSVEDGVEARLARQGQCCWHTMVTSAGWGDMVRHAGSWGSN